MKFLSVALLLLSAPSLVYSAYCNGSPDPNAAPNKLPIVPSANSLTYVKSVENGMLFEANSGLSTSFHVTHLYGKTPYDNGYAHGRLLAAEMRAFYTDTYDYLATSIVAGYSPMYLPEWMVKKVAELGLDGAMDWTYDATVAFTDPAFYEEMQGLADGCGADYTLIRRVHMLPEATKGSCSMFGASGSATASGNLLQLRALDWDVDGPFRDHTNVIVYHNDDETLQSWANIAWAGFIGSVSGFNSAKLSISEIGVSFPDDTFGEESRHGTPFVNMLRDILEKEDTFDGANSRVVNGARTCDLILGVGDAKTGQFNSIEYSYSVANLITSDNLMPVNSTWHAPIENVVYHGMDWLCPGYSLPLHDRLVANLGSLDAESAVSDVIAITQTGNLHIAVYDLAEGKAYLSFARKSEDDSNGEAKNAFARQFTEVDVTALFAQKYA